MWRISNGSSTVSLVYNRHEQSSNNFFVNLLRVCLDDASSAEVSSNGGGFNLEVYPHLGY